VASDVDLKQLAISRRPAAPAMLRTRRHVLTRYVLPCALLAGFLSLVAWASWDVVFPPHRVTVVPVLATRATVAREGTPLFNAAGWIEPRPTPIRVAALAPGVVESLLVVQDQLVAAGDPVAELVKEDAQLAYERAAADLKLQEAQAQEAEAAQRAATIRLEQPVHLEASLREAQAMLAKVTTELVNLPFQTQRAEAQLAYAKANYEGKFAAEGAVTGRAIDAAKSELDAAHALVAELRGRADSLAKEQEALKQMCAAQSQQLALLADERQARDEAAARVQGAAARVDQARVALAEAKLRLDRMTVRAPVDGRVYQLVAEPGTTLTGGMRESFDGSTVITMYRPESLQVRVDVRFEDIPKVTLGQPVEIDNPALAAPLAGKVLFVSSEVDIQKNTNEVKIEIPAPPAVFKPEMLVDVTFLAPPQDDADAEPSEELRLYVPEQLIHTDGGPFVWLADQSASVARRVSIETGGAANGGLVEVTSGLTISSRLIASGHEELHDGARIEITGEATTLASQSSRPPENHRRTMSRLPPGGEH
jgi:RND family efflux transporter MFP subunit